MNTRTISALIALLAVAGCKSSGEKPEIPQDPFEQSLGAEERELYWHQRGTDATKAVWATFRVADDTALISDGRDDGLPSYDFATHVFGLLLDNVSVFWRKELSTEAVEAYFNDFSALYPDRMANCRNDEILRWAIACTRAARITGNKMYLDEARTLYDSLWLSQVDNALGGGMWHRSDEKTSKSASANLCAVVVALNLYHATQDLKYLLQGRRLYKWAAEHMFNQATGAVSEGVNADGVRSGVVLTSDLGIFVNASMRLYRVTGSGIYFASAKKAADRLLGASGHAETMRCAKSAGESLSNGFALRCLAELASRPGCERYREFILANACSAWTSRRLSDGLNGPDWAKTPLDFDVVEPQHAVSAAILYFAASRACR